MSLLHTTNVYIFWGNRLLLIRRSKLDTNLPLWWEAPAGHVDIACPTGDSNLARLEALRELREEAGISLAPEDLHFLPQCSDLKHSSYAFIFESKLPPKITLSFEHTDFDWVHIYSTIPYSNIRKEVVDFIKKIRNG